MAKPSKQPKHTGLSTAVRNALAGHKGEKIEHRFVFLAFSNRLLERMKLPEEKLAKAKEMEAHSLRLLEATSNISNDAFISVKTARAIIEKALQNIPGFIERNKERLDKQSIANLKILQNNLQKDLGRLSRAENNFPIMLSLQFLEDAKMMHFDEIKHLLGKENFSKYSRNMDRVFKVIAEASKKKE